MRNVYTGIFVKSGRWWAGCVAEVPGANTQGRTLPEARRNLKDALRMILKANTELAERTAGPNAVRKSLSVEVG